MADKAGILFPGITHPGSFETTYSLGDLLGKGAYSEVRRCTEKATKAAYSVKLLEKKNIEDFDALKSEIAVLRKVSHPAILALKHVYESKVFVYVVAELLTGGELFDRIVERGSYSEFDAAGAVKNILDGLHYLHERRIIHRDLKPENLIYSSPADDAVLKIVDFGLARELQPGKTLHNVCGTPGYVAPEVFLSRPYTFPADMWSIGVITFILLSGYEPFYAETDDDMFALILKAEYSFASPFWDDISANAKDLISKLLCLDPSKRLNAALSKRHPWVEGRAASSTNLPQTHSKIKEFNAARHLRAGLSAVRAVRRLMSLKRSSEIAKYIPEFDDVTEASTADYE